MLSLKGSAGISGILIALLAGCHFGLPEDNAQGVAFKASAEDIGQWKAVNAKAERRGSYCVISKDASAPIYGRLDSPPLKADINKYPYLTICVDHDQNVAHGWSLALNNKTPLSGNQFTAGKGIVTYDLRGKAPWKEGENSFSLSLYVVGKDKAIRVKWIALAALPQKDCLVLTGNEGKCGFALFPAEPFTPANGEVAPEIDGAGRAMQVQGCAGEFEPGTFVIYAGRDLNALNVTASDLAGSGKNVIPAANIDVRIVKNWYQGGSGARFSEAVNVPELLLKDDGILYADTTRRENVLNFKGLPQDGPELKPFSIGKGESKQVWLTIKIPDGVASGSYVGNVKVEAASGAASDISLQVEVLPFALADSGKILGIYTWSPRVYSYAEGREALKEEMRELKRHGFNASTIMYYDPEFKVNSDGGYSVNVDSLKEEIDARMEAGLDKMIVVAFASHKYDFMRRLWNGEKNPATEEDKRKLGFIVKTLDQWAKAHGFPAIYYYGIDEPTQENRAKCKELFETIHAAGGKTYTAVFPQAAEYLGATLDLGNYIESVADQAYVNNGEIPRYQKQVLQYWHPLENPLYERMRAGLITWYGRLDGIFPYAYRHVFQGNPYYDESQGAAAGRSNERNSMYTYPAANGIIPTIQWEGMREGMDDLRYLATLREFMEAAGKAPQGRVSSETLAKARETLARPPAVFKKYEPFAIYKQLRPEDFRAWRAEMIKTIMELQQGMTNGSKR